MSSVKAGLVSHVVPELERFINRHILGLQPDPDNWPRPRDIARLPVPRGIERADDDGRCLILERESAGTWPHRRTAIGAHAYRFEQNREYDCGWRLADVAVRFLRSKAVEPVDVVTTVPPPDTYGSGQTLPWVAKRFAHLLGVDYASDLITPNCPLGKHPDIAQRLKLPPTDVFRINDNAEIGLDGKRVLLCDWWFHRGKTLRVLTRLLRKRGADVVRFAWLG